MSTKQNSADAARDQSIAMAAQLYVTGHTMRQIAAELDVSESTVSRYIATARERWRQQAAADLAEHTGLVLAELAAIKLEAWQAWRRSQLDEVKVIEERDTKKSAVGLSTTKRREERRGQAGHAQYLEIIGKAIERQCKILGIDAPEKSEFEFGDAVFEVEFQIHDSQQGDPQ